MTMIRTLKLSALNAASIAVAFVSTNVILQPASAALSESDTTQVEKTSSLPSGSLVNATKESPPTMADPMADIPVETPVIEQTVVKPLPAASTTVPAKAPVKTPAKPVSQLDQLKTLYRAGKYRDALALIAKMKQSELTHYYTGLCYQGQGQLAQAAQEFNFTASIARDPKLKYNAQVAQRAVAAYASNRTYKGQGNFFAKTVAVPRPSGSASGAGGCGPRRA